MNKYELSLKDEYSQLRLPKSLIATLKSGVSEYKSTIGNYYMLNVIPSFYNVAYNRFELFYDNLTANEYSNNKVIFEVGKYTRYALKKGISFCHRLSCILPESHGFNIIMSIDEDYVTISFHKIRKGESWISEDLEEFQIDAVVVMTIPPVRRCMMLRRS